MLQWECRVGHRYSPDTLLDAQADSVKSALWVMVRALNDRVILLGRMPEESEKHGQMRSSCRFGRQSEAASEQAQIVLRALTGAPQMTLRRVVDGEEGGLSEEGAA